VRPARASAGEAGAAGEVDGLDDDSPVGENEGVQKQWPASSSLPFLLPFLLLLFLVPAIAGVGLFLFRQRQSALFWQRLCVADNVL
jgi:hypothetical protein